MLLFRYCPTIDDKINPIPKTFLGWTSMLSFGIGGWCPVAFATSSLDVADRLLGKLVLAMRHQPPGAFRHEAAEQQDAKAECGADAETEPPADIRGEQALVEQERNSKRSCRCAEPETAVDDSQHHRDTCWNKLIDRGIDGRVLSANAEPGDHPKNSEAPEIPSKRTQQHA